MFWEGWGRKGLGDMWKKISQSLKNGLKNGEGGFGTFFRVVLRNKTGKMNVSARSTFWNTRFFKLFRLGPKNIENSGLPEFSRFTNRFPAKRKGSRPWGRGGRARDRSCL